MSRGESLEKIMGEMTVEGVPTAEVAVYFADSCNLELPIFRLVDSLLKGTMQLEVTRSG